jgi:putative phage-type endonuclease
MPVAPQLLDREEWWHRQRQSGIGGSDIGPVLGFPAFGRTVIDVWEEKVSTVPLSTALTPDMQRGMALEQIAIDQYVLRTGRKLRRQPMRRHRDLAFLVGNVDRQQVGDPRGPGIAEVKVPRLRTFARIKAEGLKEYYWAQMQHYLVVFDYTWGTFIIFNADAWEVIWFDVERDEKWSKKIIEEGTVFWREYVVKNVRPPEPKQSELKMEAPTGQIIQLDDPAFAEIMSDFWEAQTLFDTGKLLLDTAKEHIKEFFKAQLGGFAVVETPNAERIYYKHLPGSRSFDKKLLAGAAPLDPIKVRQILQSDFAVDVVNQLMDEIFRNARLNLDDFYKTGAGSEKLLTYQLKRRIQPE